MSFLHAMQSVLCIFILANLGKHISQKTASFSFLWQRRKILFLFSSVNRFLAEYTKLITLNKTKKCSRTNITLLRNIIKKHSWVTESRYFFDFILWWRALTGYYCILCAVFNFSYWDQMKLFNIKVDATLLCVIVVITKTLCDFHRWAHVVWWKFSSPWKIISRCDSSFIKKNREKSDLCWMSRPHQAKISFSFVEHREDKEKKTCLMQLEIPVSLLSFSLSITKQQFLSMAYKTSCYTKWEWKARRWFVKIWITDWVFVIRSFRANCELISRCS